MKKYFFIFIFTVPFLYSMKQSAIPKSEELILAYLPVHKGQSYFSPQEITSLSRETHPSIYTYIGFLKKEANQNYKKAIDIVQKVITSYEEEVNASNSLLAISNTPAKVLESNDTYQQAKSVLEELKKDQDNWQTSSKTTYFHPLLFLPHPDHSTKFIIFGEKRWFDIAKGHIIVISSQTTDTTTSSTLSKKIYDRHKHSIKKQKLVQDGR